jgi:SAM-dependent methyltransferase
MSILKKDQDPIGHAVWDYLNGVIGESILVRTDIAEDEHLSPAYFFREFHQMPIQEQEALKRAKGRILDVGAGAGAHSLWLQEQGFEVDAIDISPLLCRTMRNRGVKNVLLKDIYTLKGYKYDTILLLMNGAGVAQTLRKLEKLFLHLKTLLNPEGKILADSSDLLYLFTDENGDTWINIASYTYYGEMQYQLSYKDIKGNTFPWLFVDPESFINIANQCGFRLVDKILGAHFDYMIEITL